jgi:hypothetical protein
VGVNDKLDVNDRLDVLELLALNDRLEVFVGDTLIELVGVGKRVYDSPVGIDNKKINKE